MPFVSQLVSFWLIFQTQNPLVSGCTNGQDKCLLSVYFENQIDTRKVYYVFLNVLWAGYIRAGTSSITFDNIGINETGL